MKRLLAVAGLALAPLLVPSAAAGAEGLVVSDVRVDAGLHSVSAVLTAPSLPQGTGLDPASVVAQVDGRVLPSSVVAESPTTTQAPSLLLVVDTSGSMQGSPMTEAKQALSVFITGVAPEVRIGLLAFGDEPRLLVEPTRDRGLVLGAVSGLAPQGETALYDAVLAGLAELGPQGDRRLVVLSDGGDTRSRADLAAAVDGARTSGVVVDAIGFRTDESVEGVLQQLAAGGRGRLHDAGDAVELGDALTTTTRSLATEVTVDVLVPEDVRGDRQMTFTASTAAGPLRATAPVTLGAAAAVQRGHQGWWATPAALATGLACLAAGLLLGALAVLGTGQTDRRRALTTLDRFTTTASTDAQRTRGTSPLTRTALVVAERVATARGLQDRLTRRLDRAAMSFAPAEWLLLQAGVGVGTLLLLALVGTHVLLALAAAVVAGALVPTLLLRCKAARRQRAFQDGLPDTLQLVAGGLSAGYSLGQALDGVVQEGSQPMVTEFGRALAESRLGVPVEKTLEGVADRMDSRDFAWVVMAIRVQREVGGNLAGVLTTVSATMRERAMLRRHVRALSAEGRLSAYILLGLPVALSAYLLAVRREYLEPMYSTGLGIGLVVSALVLMTVGSFAMSRLVKVEV